MIYKLDFNGKHYLITTKQATKTVIVGKGKKAHEEEIAIPDEVIIEVKELDEWISN